MNAQNRRYAAVRATVERFLDNGFGELASDVTRTDLVTAVDELVDLGRTDRWRDTVNAWADMIRDETTDPRWALVEGSTRAIHAA